jgi:cytochrome c2
MKRALAALVASVSLAGSGCDLSAPTTLSSKWVQNGDERQGRALVASGRFGCAACHAIPGVDAPKGVVGPALGGVADRAFIAGQLPNKPDVLVAFLRNPPGLVPLTGMPDVGLTGDQARDIAAYLYTLRAANER